MGLLNHERAMHQAQRSKHLAANKAQSKSNRWTEQEIDRFKRLVQTFGLKSNKLLAMKMGTKSVGQVAGFKQRFHPLWRRFDYGTPTLDSSPRSLTETTSSPASTVSNKVPSPSTTEMESSDCDRFAASLTQHRAQSTLLNRADDLIAALRVPILPQLAQTNEQSEALAELGQRVDQHAPRIQQNPAIARDLEIRPSLQTPVEPAYERLRLDLTEKDFNSNNLETTTHSSEQTSTTTITTPIHPQIGIADDTTPNTSQASSPIHPQIGIADDTTPSTSQTIRKVISNIRKAVEEDEVTCLTSQQEQQEDGKVRPRVWNRPTGEGQHGECESQMREGVMTREGGYKRGC